ncbi:MAG: nucleotide kinase domain-containing protein [Alcanivorax sp.]
MSAASKNIKKNLPDKGLSFLKRKRPKPTEVFDTYWIFSAERQKVFMRRVLGSAYPWTKDAVIKKHKFTNIYRASDRVSQFLIKKVIYGNMEIEKEDTIFRILLFKVFNRIETWNLFEEQVGGVGSRSFSVEGFSEILDRASSVGGKIYSAAYIMPSGPNAKYKGKKKHRFHLELMEYLWKEGAIKEMARSRSMSELYHHLLSVPSFGSFLAYQYAIDINYSDVLNFSENDFVVPGPGALNGIKKCFSDFGDYSPEDIVKMMVDEQESHFYRLGLGGVSLWGRPLHLIDCQNIFCETDKYARVAHPEVSGVSGRSKIKQNFKGQASLPNPWYPPKWKINGLIRDDLVIT